ncbi:MAG: hypothetical protein AB1735_04100, partial [Pseudomonadota bacterium]
MQKALVAWGLVRRIDELEAQLKPLKAELGAALEGHSLVVPKVCRVSAVRSSSVSLADAEKMQQLLGERFADLVEQSVSYKPSEKLLQMSSDGDDPWAPAYRALLRVRNTLAVRIGPEVKPDSTTHSSRRYLHVVAYALQPFEQAVGYFLGVGLVKV